MTIYEQLGGEETFQAVSEHFYSLVLKDELLMPYFEGKDTKGLIKHQATFLAAVAGGPAFTGRSMEKAHLGLNISEEAFAKVAFYLLTTLTHFNVTEDIKSTMLEAAGKLKSQIVGK
jgi:hemoglobin